MRLSTLVLSSTCLWNGFHSQCRRASHSSFVSSSSLVGTPQDEFCDYIAYMVELRFSPNANLFQRSRCRLQFIDSFVCTFYCLRNTMHRFGGGAVLSGQDAHENSMRPCQTVKQGRSCWRNSIANFSHAISCVVFS
jgi:hypothetical protein